MKSVKPLSRCIYLFSSLSTSKNSFLRNTILFSQKNRSFQNSRCHIEILFKYRSHLVPAVHFSTGMAQKPFERLGLDVKPVNYNLRLKPDLTLYTFEGTEEIQVEVGKAVSSVTLNSCDINVKEASYQAQGSDVKVEGDISYEEDAEKVTFTFPSEIQPGEGTLALKFTGNLNDKMKGFYRSKYTTPNGEERIGAVTQFEATDARRAFPCWDEPAVKATFDVTLVVPTDRVALSNMPVTEEEPLEGDAKWKVMTYQRSPIMSTYLLAFVVGEYDFVEGKDDNGVLIRVYTPVGKKEQGRFALDVAVKTLPFYKNYFKIAYPLPKMDLIAIADFAAGAMENWGLVTYRETALLIDPQTSSSKTKQWVALVVGHELAHQWFGNLVTMEWWTHLWLNEGFASWIEYLCVDHCFPEFDIWTQFVNQDLGRALELDALHNSHPIEVPVGHPDEVDEIFDAISYSKGASVIRMLHDYIGDDDFKVGMNQYLTKFQYKNAYTENLWEYLEKASGKPVQDVMSTWTQQMGFPVIKMEEKQDGDNRIIHLSQEKFCADGKLPEGCKSQWMTPLRICSSCSNVPVTTHLLNEKSMSITLNNIKPNDWVKLNSETVGVYRVQYSSETLARLIPAVRDRTLPPRDRLGLQSDLFALARAGMAPSVDALDVADAYINEDNYTVWNDLAMNLGGQGVLLQNTNGYDNYKAFCRNLFRKVYKAVGWDEVKGEETLMAMLRDLVLTKMGRCGDSEVVAEANRRFEAHVSGEKLLSANLRSPVYITVLANGDEETYNKMLKLYDDADMQEEKVRISRSLGNIKSAELKKKVLEFAMSDKVRSQDTVFVIAGITNSVEGREIAWKFVQDQWEELHNRYKGGFLLSRLVKTTTENFVTEKRAEEVEEFFKKNPAPAAERTVQQSCENIRLNAMWMERDSEKVQEFLKKRVLQDQENQTTCEA